jgi:hypothetical protein
VIDRLIFSTYFSSSSTPTAKSRSQFFTPARIASDVPMNCVRGAGGNKFSWGQKAERTGIWDYVNEKLQWHNRQSNPLPPDLQRSASINCTIALFTFIFTLSISFQAWLSTPPLHTHYRIQSASSRWPPYHQYDPRYEQTPSLALTAHTITISKKEQRGTRWRNGWGTALQTGRSRDRFVRIFHWHNPSGRTMAPGSTQPLTEMSTRNVSWG